MANSLWDTPGALSPEEAADDEKLERKLYAQKSPKARWIILYALILGTFVTAALLDPATRAGASAIWRSFLGSVPSLLYGLKMIVDS